VNDTNDNRPEFALPLYTAELIEADYTLSCHHILNVTAVDIDKDENSEIHYSIIEGNQGGLRNNGHSMFFNKNHSVFISYTNLFICCKKSCVYMLLILYYIDGLISLSFRFVNCLIYRLTTPVSQLSQAWRVNKQLTTLSKSDNK